MVSSDPIGNSSNLNIDSKLGYNDVFRRERRKIAFKTVLIGFAGVALGLGGLALEEGVNKKRENPMANSSDVILYQEIVQTGQNLSELVRSFTPSNRELIYHYTTSEVDEFIAKYIDYVMTNKSSFDRAMASLDEDLAEVKERPAVKEYISFESERDKVHDGLFIASVLATGIPMVLGLVYERKAVQKLNKVILHH